LQYIDDLDFNHHHKKKENVWGEQKIFPQCREWKGLTRMSGQ
jgi:hypothetical protein